jgi:hypothetical protein
MASCTLLLELEISDMAADDVAFRIWPGPGPGDPNNHRVASNVAKLVEAVAGGACRGNGWVTVNDDTAVAATGTVTPVYANMANDWLEFRYNGVAIARLTEGVDYVRGANLAAATAALAAAINNHPILRGLVNAGASATAVSLIATAPDPLARNIDMATNDATAFTLVQLTGGTTGVTKLPLTYMNLGAAP